MTDSIDKVAEDSKEVVLHGIGVSPGVAVGPVFLLGSEDDHFVERSITDDEVGAELCRLEEAIIETRQQVRELQKSVESQMKRSDASILDVHLMVLDDSAFMDEVVAQIQVVHVNAEAALWNASEKYAAVLADVEDAYLRERVADVRDVTRRLMRNVAGREDWFLGELKQESIVVASDLAPSQTAALPKDIVLGFVTDLGSPTSHSAVMARSMKIPAVVAMHDVTSRVVPGDEVLMDGNKGVLIVNPTAERLEEYGRVVEERKHIASDLEDLKDEPAETRDGGRRVVLSANIEMPEDVDSVQEFGAEGVGLFRSEYAYLAGTESMTEEEFAAGYEKVTSRLAPAPVTIRTLDLGGDKFTSYMQLPKEANPFLGCRSIRLMLNEPELFKVQLRAILRASSHGNTKIMYPMISNAGEVLQANKLLGTCKDELRAAKVPFDEDIEVGVMIETPSAALTCDLIAPHVKFFSIGTNDLIQYTIAVDRVNELVAYLYEPTHPAILKLIKATVESGRKHGIPVSLCGEMAADPVMSPLLIGLGVDTLSMSPSAIPAVKDVVRSVSHEEVNTLATDALKCRDAAEVSSLSRELIRKVAPEILELTA